MPKRQFNFDSRLQSFRGAPQTMEAPVGLRNPNIQTAHRYFAENQAKDTNLQRLVASNYKAGITRKRQYETDYGCGQLRISRRWQCPLLACIAQHVSFSPVKIKDTVYV